MTETTNFNEEETLDIQREIHSCHSENKIILRIIAGAFSVFIAVIPICYFLSNSAIESASRDLMNQIQLKLIPMIEKSKQNELRIVRIEDAIISGESRATANNLKLSAIDKKIDELVSQLKYVYPTKEYVDEELKKKVDLDRIDKRNLKN